MQYTQISLVNVENNSKNHMAGREGARGTLDISVLAVSPVRTRNGDVGKERNTLRTMSSSLSLSLSVTSFFHTSPRVNVGEWRTSSDGTKFQIRMNVEETDRESVNQVGRRM